MKFHVVLLVVCLEFYKVNGNGDDEQQTKHKIKPDLPPSPSQIQDAINALTEDAKDFWTTHAQPQPPSGVQTIHERKKRQVNATTRAEKRKIPKRRPDDTFCRTLVQFTPREDWRDSLEYGYVYVIAGFTEAKCLTRQSRIVYGICKQEYQWIFLPVLNCEIFANKTIGECKADYASIRYASGCTAHAVDVPFCGDVHSPLQQLGPTADSLNKAIDI
ncbi:unnamed protein product [Owenia fusiformis]|uniref:Lipocalin n=1 Tax=Owenia fusiformis TaxID=6347 RepID=A0A8S4PQ20_OWEFU|nr:unnamed protein product [Owenia fusiformis]